MDEKDLKSQLEGLFSDVKPPLSTDGAGEPSHDLETLHRLGQVLGAATQLDPLLQTLHRQVEHLFDISALHVAVITGPGPDETCVPIFHVEHGAEPGQPQGTGRAGPAAALDAWVVRSREPLLLRDLREKSTFFKTHGLGRPDKRVKAWLGVPLIVADRVLGVMAIWNEQLEGCYDERDVLLLATVAGQVAALLHGLRLSDEVRRRAEELALVSEVGRAINSVLDLHLVLRQIVDTIKARFGHYFVNIALLEQERLVLHDGSTIGDSEERLEPGRVALDVHKTGLMARAARTGLPVLAKDVALESEYVPFPELAGTRSELVVPIQVAEQTIGVLDVQSERPNAYGETDVALLRLLAGQAAVAIRNARLYEDAQRRAENQAGLARIAALAASTLDLEELLQRLLREALQAVGAETAVLLLLDPDQEALIARYLSAGGQGRLLPFADEWRVPLNAPGFERSIFARGGVYYSNLGLDDPNIIAAYRAAMKAVNARNFCGLAIRSRERSIGELYVVNRPAGFGPDELRFLRALVGYVSSAIENANLFQEARRSSQELSALYELSLELAQGQQELHAALERIAGRCMELLDADGAGVWLWREKSADLELVVSFQRGGAEMGGRRLKPGEGLTGLAFSEKRTQVVDDYQSWPARPDTFGDAAFATAVVAPLLWQNQVLGALAVTRDQRGRRFTSAEQRLIEMLAAQAAASSRSVRLVEDRERRIAELTVLSQIGRSLSSATELDALLEAIYRQIGGIFDTANFYIVLYEPGASYWENRLHVEHGERIPNRTYPLSTGLTGYIIQTGRSLLLSSVEENETFRRQHGIALVDSCALSWMGVPLVTADKVTGVIGVQDYRQEHLYTQQDLELLSTIAAQAAVAIENVRLFQEAQRRAERERRVRTAVDSVRRATGTQAVMRKALQELGQMLGASQSVLHLGVREQLETRPAGGGAPAGVPALEPVDERGE